MTLNVSGIIKTPPPVQNAFDSHDGKFPLCQSIRLQLARSHGRSIMSQALSLVHSHLSGRATGVDNRGLCTTSCGKNGQRRVSSIELIF